MLRSIFLASYLLTTPALAQEGTGASPAPAASTVEPAAAGASPGGVTPSTLAPDTGATVNATAGSALKPSATPPTGAAPLDASGARNPFATEGAEYDNFRDVAGELRCPTCTGLSVLDSDATFSLQIRDIVQEQIRAGKSKPEILNYFTERYGAWILRAPPTKGFNAFAWLFPIALLVLGPPLVWFFVWRKRRIVSTMGVRSADDIIKEMNEALSSLRGSKSQGAS